MTSLLFIMAPYYGVLPIFSVINACLAIPVYRPIGTPILSDHQQCPLYVNWGEMVKKKKW